ncbi:hypothetical protein AAG570_003446 [Ranatra chinensis]|uniref:Uncharacterized protein n=1 Tax=Ranatra chinensis TaxID=642074 RepID=A0ABD0Y3T0_9HEMI
MASKRRNVLEKRGGQYRDISWDQMKKGNGLRSKGIFFQQAAALEPEEFAGRFLRRAPSGGLEFQMDHFLRHAKYSRGNVLRFARFRAHDTEYKTISNKSID